MPSEQKDAKEKPADVNVLRIGETEAKLPSPIDLNMRMTKEVELPSLKWSNADESPRLMKITNSGHSIIVTAKWLRPSRPYITGSQLPGMYIFSQAHFHWGKNEQEGSEHTIEGAKQPLELHVTYFKTDYGTPEKAMKELDGTVVMAYLYNVRKEANVRLSPITDAMPNIIQPYTSSQIELMPIAKLAPVFTDDYFLYWGSVYAQTNYKILWLIHREAQIISAQQLATFRMMIGADKEPLLSNFRDTKSVNGRTILFVNPGKNRMSTLIEAPPDPEEKENTPPPGDKKPGKGNKANRPAHAHGQRSKSIKRKSTAERRKSKKESDKVHKSPVDDHTFHDHSSHDHCGRDPVLMTAVPVTVQEPSPPSSTSTETTSSSSSSDQESCYKVDSPPKLNKLLFQPPKEKPMVDISSVIGEGNFTAKCDQILNLLHSCSKARKETCWPILEELERYVKANKDSIGNDMSQEKTEGALRTDYVSNENKTLSRSFSKDESSDKLRNVKLVTFKDPIVVSETNNDRKSPLTSRTSSHSRPSSARSPSPPKATSEIKRYPIQRYKCAEMQYAEIYHVPAPERRTLTRKESSISSQLESAKSKQHPQSQIPLRLIERVRSGSQAGNSKLQVNESLDAVDSSQTMWQLPELLSNSTLLTGLLQQVAGTSGLKFVSNETMVLTAQSSTEDNTITREPSITQNVSYVAQQNTFLEIDQSSKSSIPGRFIGQKLDSLDRESSPASNAVEGSTKDSGIKRQTMIKKIFQNNNSPPRSNARVFKGSGIASPTSRACPKVTTPSTGIKKPKQSPWKY